MRVSTTFGVYKSGELTDDAKLFAQKIIAEGGQITLQGPEISNRNSDNVTLLWRNDNDYLNTGWMVWGKTKLKECEL